MGVRCEKCQFENANIADKCEKCGGALERRRHRRRGISSEVDTPFAAEVVAHNKPALRAYRLALLGIVPGVGLVCGPIASILGVRARMRGLRDPLFTARSPALVSIILGVACTISNWVGFTLMYLGLRDAGWW